jgi:LysR family transcriptional regulator, regulator for metE and metH
MNISLTHFRLVDTIVKEGTLTRAAETLHLTQSALSHQLKELEQEMGMPVFYRKGKRLELTPEGTRFLRSAEKILAELTSLEADIRQVQKGEAGTLRVTTQCYTAYHWLPRIIKYYKSISPGINIHVVSAATYVPLEYLLRGDLDIAIVRNTLDNPRIRYEPIFEDRVYAIVSRKHPLADRSSMRAEDFQDQELFLPFNDPASGNIPVIENLLKAHHVIPRHVHRIHYTDAIIEMVDANLGITTLADWIVQPYLETRDIVALPLPPEVANRTWCAATCKDTLPIRNFLDCLKLHFRSTEPVPALVTMI